MRRRPPNGWRDHPARQGRLPPSPSARAAAVALPPRDPERPGAAAARGGRGGGRERISGKQSVLACLEPYTRVFPRKQICVARFEDMVTEPAPGWSAILAHLGLADRPLPGTVWNFTADKPGYSRTTLKLYEKGLLRPAKYLPGPVRRIGKALLTRGGSEYAHQLDQSSANIPTRSNVRSGTTSSTWRTGWASTGTSGRDPKPGASASFRHSRARSAPVVVRESEGGCGFAAESSIP